MRKWIRSIWFPLILGVVGLIAVTHTACQMWENPDTGEKMLKMDPCTAAAIDKFVAIAGPVIDVAAPAAEVAAPGIPWLLPVLLVVGWGLGQWKKLSPALRKADTQVELANSAGRTAALAYEAAKKDLPENARNTIRDRLSQAVGPVIENIIRGWRGLPPKI